MKRKKLKIIASVMLPVALLCGVVYGSMAEWHTITNWVCNQNYTRAQLQNVTRDQVRTIAANSGYSEVQIRRLMSRYHSLVNVAWTDWREKRIEAARGLLEVKVQEYDPTAIVRDRGQEVSAIDPNQMVSVFSVEVDLDLERN